MAQHGGNGEHHGKVRFVGEDPGNHLKHTSGSYRGVYGEYSLLLARSGAGRPPSSCRIY